MAQSYSSRSPRQAGPVRRRKGAGGKLAFIALLGAGAFVGGFMALWFLGSWIVGGRGAGDSSDGTGAATSVAVVAQVDYRLEPLVDLLTFRDLSYVPVKGIHLTPNVAGTAESLATRIEIADTTEINAFVIDVKSDAGWIAYETDVAMAQELGVVDNIIGDIDRLVATLQEHNIIPIARIVCFKDDVLPEKRQDLAILDSRGGLWRDNSAVESTYLNPYNHEVWEYLVDVAEDMVRRGFREIQFDYVRFPTDGDVEFTEYPGEYCSKNDAIAGFLAYARERLEKLGVWVSADVFGLVVHTTYGGDRFGQQLEKICQNVDIVCPMIYPSHYWTGDYGFDDPNANPAGIVTAATEDMAHRLPGTGAKGRPYLQDFKWGDMAYDGETMQAQIRAAEEQGFDEWILWGPYRETTVAALDRD